MNDAPFAAELYGAWDFGPVVFEDIILVCCIFARPDEASELTGSNERLLRGVIQTFVLTIPGTTMVRQMSVSLVSRLV